MKSWRMFALVAAALGVDCVSYEFAQRVDPIPCAGFIAPGPESYYECSWTEVFSARDGLIESHYEATVCSDDTTALGAETNLISARARCLGPCSIDKRTIVCFPSMGQW